MPGLGIAWQGEGIQSSRLDVPVGEDSMKTYLTVVMIRWRRKSDGALMLLVWWSEEVYLNVEM